MERNSSQLKSTAVFSAKLNKTDTFVLINVTNRFSEFAKICSFKHLPRTYNYATCKLSQKIVVSQSWDSNAIPFCFVLHDVNS